MSPSTEAKLLQIAATRNKWIGYRLGDDTVDLLESRFREEPTHRWRGVAIAAETNSGKTTIAERFLRRHEEELHLTEPSIVPVVKVEATRADENRFYDKILAQMPVYKARTLIRIADKEREVKRALSQCKTRMLVIDEFHNLMRGTPAKQRDFLIVLKTLGNELRVVLVLIGLPEIYNILQADRQFANRFHFVFLPKMQLDWSDAPDQPSEYRQFLATFETLLPFRTPSHLGEDPMAAEIYSLSEGTLGEATDLIREAAEYAVKGARDKITVRDLRECGYSPPSVRGLPPDFSQPA